MGGFHHWYRPAVYTVAPGYRRTHVIRSVSRLRAHPLRQVQRYAFTVFVFVAGALTGVVALAMVLHP